MPSPAAQPLASGSRVPRHKVFLPAEMVVGTTTSRVHLLNLSLTGALLHGETPPPAGATVQLRCSASHWLARVVWAQQKRFGVVHVAPLAAATVDALIGGPA